MQARRSLLVLLIVSVAVVFSLSMSVSAQDGSALVTQALHDVGTNCANLALNTTCLGHSSVQRTTSSGVVSTTYTQPGDRASINTTHRIQSQSLDAATGNLGVNVMKVQAGLPASSGGLVYVAFGGVTVTNEGGAGQAVWQNFSLAQAGGASDFFLVQAPQNTAAAITVNGAAVQLGSTVCIRQVSATQIMIITLDGTATIGPPGLAVTIPVGNFATAELNPMGRIIPATISGPTQVGPNDLGGCANAAGLPANILNYPIGQLVVVCPSGVGQANCTVTVNP